MTTASALHPTWRMRMSERWAAAKPMVTGLVIGLVAGPLLSSILGWQVRSGAAAAAVNNSVVAQQAMFCVERARATLPAGAQIEWSVRHDLARKFAAMSGGTADPAVVQACADGLARQR